MILFLLRMNISAVQNIMMEFEKESDLMEMKEVTNHITVRK
jgi:hypothetical protein